MISPYTHHAYPRKIRKPLGSAPQMTSMPVRFGTKAESHSSPPRKVSFPQRLWQWFTGLPQAIRQLFARLFGKKVANTTPIVSNIVDPKLRQSPAERDKVALQITNEVFPKIQQLLENDPDWESKVQECFQKSVQKHLNTTAPIRLILFEDYEKSVCALASYTPPVRTGPQAKRQDLGELTIFQRHKDKRPYQLNQPDDRQFLYSLFLHEVRHVVYHYAFDLCQSDGNKYIDYNIPPDPLEYSNIVGAPMELHLLDPLLAENPQLKPADYRATLNPAEAQAYWKPLCRFWKRTDYPLLMTPDHPMSLNLRKARKLFTEGNADKLDFYMNYFLLNELESYMTSFYRAPGISAAQLQPRVINELITAMHLRDLLRLYYEVRQVPPEQQSSLAKVIPLEQLWADKNKGVTPA